MIKALFIARVYVDRAAYAAWLNKEYDLENSLRLMAEELGQILVERSRSVLQ